MKTIVLGTVVLLFSGGAQAAAKLIPAKAARTHVQKAISSTFRVKVKGIKFTAGDNPGHKFFEATGPEMSWGGPLKIRGYINMNKTAKGKRVYNLQQAPIVPPRIDL